MVNFLIQRAVPDPLRVVTSAAKPVARLTSDAYSVTCSFEFIPSAARIQYAPAAAPWWMFGFTRQKPLITRHYSHSFQLLTKNAVKMP